MITRVRDIDPFWCGWKRVVDECLALAQARATISHNVDNVVIGAERRHFGYMCIVFYREELA